MTAAHERRYESNPRYSPADCIVELGLDGVLDTVGPGTCLAVDGPEVAPWEAFIERLGGALTARGLGVEIIDVRARLKPWPKIVELTSSALLADDPDFETLADGTLADLFDGTVAGEARAGDPNAPVTVLTGPGAALFAPDVLWYLDLPKRYAEAAVGADTARNLAQPATETASTKRLFYVDWPLLDRHRDHIAPRVDRWFDGQDVDRLPSLSGDGLRAAAAWLAQRPFRTRPTFNSTPWGGRWGQRELGMNPDAGNTALGYELIAPESGVLVGDDRGDVELPFQLLVALHPRQLLGDAVHETFGTSFPVRFDYLDTVDGGNLSVHVHPQPDYMRDVFGWPYAQHETYYMMLGGPENKVFLGLVDDVDLAGFRQDAEAAAGRGRSFDIERFVQAFPADPHQLFLIPAGTPHGSGEGNVVLEISATPYLYSLRFYDWLRRDGAGELRPVHVDHAFDNLDAHRSGTAVAQDLVPAPRPLRSGPGWREEVLGDRPDMFFQVRRLVLDESGAELPDDTDGRFHVLNVVEGGAVLLESAAGIAHPLAYAETIVVPASVGPYTLRNLGRDRARVVKALVR